MSLSGSDDYDIKIKTTSDTKGAKDTEAALKDLGGQTDKGSASFLKMSTAVAAGEAAFRLASAAVKEITGLVSDSIEKFNVQEQADTQIKAVLASTHGVAGLYLEDLKAQASALQKVTTYGDETIESAQALLLTFTSLSGPVVKQATGIVLDMSTALGQDLKSSSIQVGKALQDPVLGITALRRVGVNFSEDQKKVIQNLVDTGQKAKAQQLIMKELNSEFGGSAEAAANTYAGRMAQLKNAMGDVQESIGKAIVEGLSPFIKKAADFVASVDWEKVIDRSKEAIKNLWKEIQKIYDPVKKAYDAIENYLEPKFIALWHTIEDKVMPVLMRLWKEVIEPLIPVIGTVLVVAFGLAIDALNIFYSVIAPVIDWMLNNKEVVISFAAAFSILSLAMNFGAIVAAFQGSMAAVQLSIAATKLAATELNTFLLGAGGFAVIAAAAVAAGILIVDAGNKAKAAWDNTQKSIDSASNSNAAIITRIKDVIKNGTPEQQARARKTLSGIADSGGFASGGYTGAGGVNEVAGVVHKGEYVIPKAQVDQNTHMPKAASGSSVTINQTNNVYNQVDLDQANKELGWRLSVA